MKSPFNGMFSASVLVVVLGLIASIFGLIREQWVAYEFGVGAEIDAFSMGMTFPLFIASLVASSIAAAIIPAYLESKNKSNEREFVFEVGFILFVLLVILVLICGVASFFLMPYMAEGFDESRLKGAIFVSLLLSPLIMLQCFCAFFDGILNASGRYVSSVLSSSLVPLGTVAVLAILPFKYLWVLCLGLYLGFAAKLVMQLLALPASRGYAKLKNINVGLLHKHGLLIREFSFLLLSSATLGLLPVIGQVYAADLQEGSVASLSYANKLIGVGLAAVGAAINAVVFPVIARRAVTDKQHAIRLGTRIALIVGVAGLVLLLPVYFVLEHVVTFVFERGAFDVAATKRVVAVLYYFLPYVPFYISGMILARVAVTLNISRLFVAGNILSLLIYFVSCSVLVPQFQIKGIGISLIVVYAISCFYLYAAIHRKTA